MKVMLIRLPIAWCAAGLLLAGGPVGMVATARAAPAATVSQDRVIVDAREALKKKDKARLAAFRQAAAGHPLAQWVEYWELSNRLADAQQGELDAFYARWSGTYVEDRLRNDWLLELGRRRDFENFAKDHPAYRMNDDREVACYHLLVRHGAGDDVADAAREAWHAQRDADDGCTLLASTLVQAGKLRPEHVWTEARLSIDANRPRAARLAAAMIGNEAAQAVNELIEQPLRVLKRHEAGALAGDRAEIAVLALMRAAANDPEYAAGQLSSSFSRRLPPLLAAQAWATAGKLAAMKQQPEAVAHYAQAFKLLGSKAPGWSDDTLAWAVRAVLRSAPPVGLAGDRWAMVQRAIEAMSATERREPAWTYWKARALLARAKPGPAGEADRLNAQLLLEGLADHLGFYGQLAAEDLGRTIGLPETAQPPTDAERTAVRALPGFARALQLIGLNLRNEGVREWNYTLRGMNDRELLASAQLACEREVWDRCINTSERSRREVDIAQRYPTPMRDDVVARAKDAGLDPAYVFGLIRQESRFVPDLRSHVGASGLMQLMPATAKWTAKRIGVPFAPDQINDRDVNLQLGTAYLRHVLDDLGGSQALAAAAYNAGPSRPKRWREGQPLEAAAWAEAIPFNETRDYVKKVLANATTYALILGTGAPSLKARLGGLIGPAATSRDGATATP
ncbi:MAG: lytic transglycosylase domain-containing protein [Rubrivivax sp.]|nr:lytic transglycosylase domain-containing protein [Rubrivivax sp.]